MLQLNRDSAQYSELDFPQFNPHGFKRVRQAVELAQQRRALAQSVEEAREATNTLRLANDVKHAEQQVALRNFETEREKTFAALSAMVNRFAKTYLPMPKRLELEQQLDHLITLFNLKDFAAVCRELDRVIKRFNNAPSRSEHDRFSFARRTRSQPKPQNVSSLFKHGLWLERAGRRREAIDIYGQVLQRNPQHWQAIDRLRQLSNVRELNNERKQRSGSWARKHRRYLG